MHMSVWAHTPGHAHAEVRVGSQMSFSITFHSVFHRPGSQVSAGLPCQGATEIHLSLALKAEV